MSDIAIQVQGLGKRFRLGQRGPYRTFRESIMDTVTSPFRRKTDAEKEAGTFWALKDVNFEVKRGEVVGIIGRNGAGKSTLLKVLSRITKPTEGSITLHGRVGSLLEVGTGFHPELTGRENIYLNGAILGMRRGEIAKKFDEIVAFSEVEKFLDTPVKHYSSGMYMRLAFAVAAHLEPEILVVDEVLAVGDAEFQKKCLGKMNEVAQKGRTVLFVSHNMSAIQTLCSRCVVLKGGQVHADVPVAEAVRVYLREASASDVLTRPAQPDGRPTLTAARVRHTSTTLEGPDNILWLEIDITTSTNRRISVDLRVVDGTATPVGFASIAAMDERRLIDVPAGTSTVELGLLTEHLAVGNYFASVDVTLPMVEFYDRVDHGLAFQVMRTPAEGATRALPQVWGYGSYEIPLKLIGVRKASPDSTTNN